MESSSSEMLMDDIMDRRVLKFRAELEKAKYKLWVQDQKQVRVASLVNKSDQYYKQIKRREKAIVPKSAFYRKFLQNNDNDDNNKLKNEEEKLPSRSELIEQLRKTNNNNVKNYEDFIGTDNNDQHKSNFYHYYTNEHKNNNNGNDNNNDNNNHDDNNNHNHNITNNDNYNDNNNNINEDKVKSDGNSYSNILSHRHHHLVSVGISNVFAFKISKLFGRYINFRHNNFNREFSSFDEKDNVSIDINSVHESVSTIDTTLITETRMSEESYQDDQLIDEKNDNNHNTEDNNNQENIIDKGETSLVTLKDKNSDNNDVINHESNLNESDVLSQHTIVHQPAPPTKQLISNKKNRPVKTVIVKNTINNNVMELGYKGVEYVRRQYWSPRSRKLESSLRLIMKKNCIENNVIKMHQISRASNVPMVDTFIKIDNRSQPNVHHLSCVWKYLTKEYTVSETNVYEDEINPFVKEFVNDFQPLIQLDTDAHLSHHVRNNGQYPEKFPTKAMLKAVTKRGDLHYRPLCTAGDVVLAIFELMDSSIFDHGYVQLPHVISGPFVRESEGFYRFTYKLNTPGEWVYLKKRLSSKNALFEFLCPNVCLDAFFETKVISSSEIDSNLRDRCTRAIEVLKKNLKEDEILLDVTLDFEACAEMKYNVDHHNVFYPQEKISFEPVDNIALPTFSKKRTVEDNANDQHKRVTKKVYSKADSTQYRLLHVVKCHSVSRIAHYRRNAITSFYGVSKLQEFNVLLLDEKRKVIEADKANVARLKVALESFRRINFDNYETVDEIMEEVIEKNSIFGFPKSWKHGKKKYPENKKEEGHVETKQPYSLERMRARELALKWFEDDFDDSDDDGERIIQSDSDSDNVKEYLKSGDTADSLSTSRLEAQKIKSDIKIEESAIVESRNMVRESKNMSFEDFNTLKIKIALVNRQSKHRQIEIKREAPMKTVTTGVTLKGVDNAKSSQISSIGTIHFSKISNEVVKAKNQIVERREGLQSPSTYVPLTYTTPTVNNLIKLDTDKSMGKFASEAHAKHVKLKSSASKNFNPTTNIETFIKLWGNICDEELRLLEDLDMDNISKREFKIPTPHSTILSSTAFDVASKLSPELIIDGTTVSERIDEIKVKTLKSQAIDRMEAAQRMERFHRERRARAISEYKQDCEEALKGLLKGMEPSIVISILKGIKQKRNKRKKKRRKSTVIIIPRKEEGGYPIDDEKLQENLADESNNNSDDDDDDDDNDTDSEEDDGDDDDNDKVSTGNKSEQLPQEVDLSLLLASFTTDPTEPAKEKVRKPKLKPTRRSSVYDNTFSSGAKVKSRVERMSQAMRKMLAKVIFSISTSTIDGDLVEEESRAIQKAQEEADRLKKLNAYRQHLLPKTCPRSASPAETVGGKLWGDDLTEKLVKAVKFESDNDNSNSNSEAGPGPGLPTSLFTESTTEFDYNDDSNDDNFDLVSQSEHSLIFEIINEPRVVVSRSNPNRIRSLAIHNIVNSWIEIARENASASYYFRANQIGIEELNRGTGNVTADYDDLPSSSSVFEGVSSIVVTNNSTVSKLTSESYPSDSNKKISESSFLRSSFWDSYDLNKKTSQHPLDSPAAIKWRKKADKKSLVDAHKPDVKNLIIISKTTSNNSSNLDDKIAPFTPIPTNTNEEKILFPRSVHVNNSSDDFRKEIKLNKTNEKASSILRESGTDWIPSMSVYEADQDKPQESPEHTSVFEIPNHYDTDIFVPPYKTNDAIPLTIEKFFKVSSNNIDKQKVSDSSKHKGAVAEKKKSMKSAVFSSIHSLSRGTSSTATNIDASDLDYAVLGASIPIPYDHVNYKYDYHSTYDNEYKKYLEEEAMLSGLEIGLIISHFETKSTEIKVQHESKGVDESVRKFQDLMTECFRDNLPFVIGKRFQPTLEDIYERSESEIKFGLGMDSSILDAMSSSIYKDLDKDYSDEMSIDDSSSAVPVINISSSASNHHAWESEFSSLLLIEKINGVASLTHSTCPKRPVIHKRTNSNYHSSQRKITTIKIKNSSDNGNNEENLILTNISVNIKSDVVDKNRVAADESDSIDRSKVSVGSVYLNSYLDSGIAQEDETKSKIRDIAPTFSGRYLESKRRLFSRESKERDIGENSVHGDNDKRPISPSRGNKSPSSKGTLRSYPSYQINEKLNSRLELVGVKQEVPISTHQFNNQSIKEASKDISENSEVDSIKLILGPTIGSDLYRFHIERRSEDYFRSAFMKPVISNDTAPLVVQATKKVL